MSRLGRWAVSAGIGVALALSVGAPADAAGRDDASLQVQVIASVGAPPAAPSTPPAAGPVRGSAGAGASATTPPAAVSDAAPAPAAGEIDVAGILFVGGLSATSAPSPDPLGGTVTASFTVRNVSASTFDAVATFTLDGPVGNRISTVDVRVDALQPGAARVVTAELPGAGQWGFLTTRAVFVPPDVIDGVEMTEVTREASLFAVPWLVGVLVVAGAVAFLAVRLVHVATMRGTAAAGAPA